MAVTRRIGLHPCFEHFFETGVRRFPESRMIAGFPAFFASVWFSLCFPLPVVPRQLVQLGDESKIDVIVKLTVDVRPKALIPFLLQSIHAMPSVYLKTHIILT